MLTRADIKRLKGDEGPLGLTNKLKNYKNKKNIYRINAGKQDGQ